MIGKPFPLIFWYDSKNERKILSSHFLECLTFIDLMKFSLNFWIITKNERKGFSSHFLNLSPLIWQKKTVKLEELEIATFSILGHLFVFLMYFQECHYCQSDLVVIEFTGRSPCTRRLLKSSALRSFLVLGPWPVNSITTKSSWQ